MKLFFISSFFLTTLCSVGQTFDSIVNASTSLLKIVQAGDSITYYQCHVEEGTQQLSTASGQTLIGAPEKYSITEKFVITKTSGSYVVNYYTSSLTVFPNKKFSGLKIRQRPYWNFKKEKEFVLSERDVKILLALESKGREAMEYDYPINKYTTNQLIIKHGKNFKQLVIDGNYVVSKLLSQK